MILQLSLMPDHEGQPASMLSTIRLVCQNAFCYIHKIGNFTLRALRKHIGESGPVPRQHGNKGRKAYPFDVKMLWSSLKIMPLCSASRNQQLLGEEQMQPLHTYLLIRTTQLCIKSIVKHAVKNTRSRSIQVFLIHCTSVSLRLCL